MQQEGIMNVAVCNQAAGGNTMLSGGLGPPLVNRYKRDAIDQPGVGYVMIFEGVNDIGNTGDGQAPQLADRIIALYKTIIKESKAKGYKTIGATITPFNGQGQSYSGAGREQARVKVNNWIMTSGEFDLAVDFSKSIGSGQQLIAQYDGGDHLHPNVAGYTKMAADFPLAIFKS
jgi:lysophospholipase L1-like esterase